VKLILTKFINRIQLRKNNKYRNSFILAQKNFFLYEEFKKWFSLEKRRAEKINSPLSIILSDLEFDKKLNRYLFCGIDGNLLIEIILSTVRETDVVSLQDFKEVIVILPDTDPLQAQVVVSGIIEKLKEIQNDKVYEEEQIFHKFKIVDVHELEQKKRISLGITQQASGLS